MSSPKITFASTSPSLKPVVVTRKSLLQIYLFVILLSAYTTFIYAKETPLDDYINHIKPILHEKCFSCHGVSKQKGKLRLDTVEFMKQNKILSSGELISRLTHDDPKEIMPPEGEPLKPEMIQMIQNWIQAGAPAPELEQPEKDAKDHWAFQKIVRPKVPQNKEPHPIDAFLHQYQNKRGTKPQGLAKESILKRRLYLDLIGLPPNFENLQEDISYEQLIDRLLASPQHGERWGRHWMDIWRYSEWYGLGQEVRDSHHHMWHWRDWIINSINQNKGYDQMVKEMLAGDEIAPTDPKIYAATGYLARSYYKFNRTTWLDSTVEHTGKAFLGLTMNCAKCHDHKYDPISHEEYYQMRAIFEPHHIRIDPVPGQTNLTKNGIPRAYDEYLSKKTYLHLRGEPSRPDKSKDILPGVPKLFSKFYKEPVKQDLPSYAWAPGIRTYVQEDHLASVRQKLKLAEANLAKLTKQKPIVQVKRTLSNQGVSFQETFDHANPKRWKILGSGWRFAGGVIEQTQANPDKQHVRSLVNHPANFEVDLVLRIKGGPLYRSAGISFDTSSDGKSKQTVYLSAFSKGPKIQVGITENGVTAYPSLGRKDTKVQLNRDYTLKIRVRDRLVNVFLDGEFMLAYHIEKRLPSRRLELFAYDSLTEFDSLHLKALSTKTPMRESQTAYALSLNDNHKLKASEIKVQEAKSHLAMLEAKFNFEKAYLSGLSLEPFEKAFIAKERNHNLTRSQLIILTGKPRAKKLAQKQYTRLKNQVLPKKAIFNPISAAKIAAPNKTKGLYPKESTGRRLSFANWIVHRDNPLAARVAVNHIWLRHFGEPLVKHVFDFGRQSPQPPLQDLLDYLAIEFIESGWDMKKLHKLMLSSKAYRRTSSNLNADQATLEIDPSNHSFWRMNSRRMESQVVRDTLISLSGKLNLKMGGPPVSLKKDSQRRSVYLQHSRDDQAKFLSKFDEAEVLACYRRSESIVPQQALALANSKLSLLSSQHIAKHHSLNHTRSSIQKIFFTLLAREANEEELQLCLNYIQDTVKLERLVHALINHNDFIMIR